MRDNMFDIGDKFRTVPLNEHIKHLIEWRRRETDPKIIRELNEELDKYCERTPIGVAAVEQDLLRAIAVNVFD